jgi:hypothetical protein
MFLDVDDAFVGQHRTHGREHDADVDAHLAYTRRIFAGVDSRCPCGRQAQADRSKHNGGFTLSKHEASARRLEAKPEFENTEPLAKLAVISLVLPRIEASIVEGTTPALPLAASGDDQARVGGMVRPRQVEQHGKRTGQTTGAMRNSQTAPQPRLGCMSDTERFGKLWPCGAEESRVQPRREATIAVDADERW